MKPSRNRKPRNHNVWSTGITPTIEELRANGDGNPDIELILTRLEQIDNLGSALAAMVAAMESGNPDSTVDRVAKCRNELAGALSVSPRPGTETRG